MLKCSLIYTGETLRHKMLFKTETLYQHFYLGNKVMTNVSGPKH